MQAAEKEGCCLAAVSAMKVTEVNDIKMLINIIYNFCIIYNFVNICC